MPKLASVLEKNALSSILKHFYKGITPIMENYLEPRLIIALRGLKRLVDDSLQHAQSFEEK